MDTRRVHVHPVGHALEALTLQFGDASGGVGADVEQQVAAHGDHVGEQLHRLRTGHVGVGVLHLVVAEGVADASGHLPHALAHELLALFVFDGAEVPMGQAPAVVDHTIRHHVVVMLEQSGHAEIVVLLRDLRHVDISPQDGRLVFVDEVHHMRVHIAGVVLALRPVFPVAENRHVGLLAPVEARGVVHAELQSLAAHGVGEFLDQIAMRTTVHGIPPIVVGGLPQRDAFVMLRGRHEVPGTGACEQVGHVRGVERLGLPHVDEVLIRHVTVDFLLMLGRRRALDAHRVPIPFRIRAVGVPVHRIVKGAKRTDRLRPCRHRIRTPVGEDAETGALEPFGCIVHELLIHLGTLRIGHEQHHVETPLFVVCVSDWLLVVGCWSLIAVVRFRYGSVAAGITP